MNEKELLDMMTAERIDMLLRQQQRPGENQEVSQIIKQAQLLLEHMPHDEWIIMNQYMDHQTDQPTMRLICTPAALPMESG